MDADLIIVGAGFFGATLAERAARECGLKVLIIDRRAHIGGNAYSATDAATGIEVHKYGPHFFHTSNAEVWNYLNRFTQFTNYQYWAFRRIKQGFSLPINRHHVTFWQAHESDEACGLIADRLARSATMSPKSRGKGYRSSAVLYEAFIKGYTIKQWQTDPPTSRLNHHAPVVRYDFNSRIFDTYEGLPKVAIKHFEKMWPNIQILLTRIGLPTEGRPRLWPVGFHGLSTNISNIRKETGWRTWILNVRF
jgi:UDP-galactopyranose mutase